MAEVVDNLVWHDAAELPIRGKGWRLTKSPYDRLPPRALGFVPDGVWTLSRHCAGLHIVFKTKSPAIHVRWQLLRPELSMHHMPATGVSGLDLYGRNGKGKWRFIDNSCPKAQAGMHEFRMCGQKWGQYLLYLPLYNGLTKLEIGLPEQHKLVPLAEDQSVKPIVVYGTSITQGACASRPGTAAFSIAARQLDVPIINLGFSGSGKMEIELAEMLAELDARFYVLDNLRNMAGLVEERFEPFVRRLHKLRPDKRIVVTEDTDFRNMLPTQITAAALPIVNKLIGEGMGDILTFEPCKGMLGTDWETVIDRTHFNDIGMLRQAKVLVKMLKKYIAMT